MLRFSMCLLLMAITLWMLVSLLHLLNGPLRETIVGIHVLARYA
jgi:hypothetical protein